MKRQFDIELDCKAVEKRELKPGKAKKNRCVIADGPRWGGKTYTIVKAGLDAIKAAHPASEGRFCGHRERREPRHPLLLGERHTVRVGPD